MNAFDMNNIYYFHHFGNLRAQLFMKSEQNLANFLSLIMHGALLSFGIFKTRLNGKAILSTRCL